MSFLAPPAVAQSGALVFQIGGSLTPKFGVGESGDQVGGAVALTGSVIAQVGSAVAIRASGARYSSDLTGSGVSLTDRGLKRTLLMGDLLFGVSTQIGARPYFFGGAGQVTLDPDEPGLASTKNLALRFGTGINYLLDPTNLVLSIEIAGVVHRFDVAGFNKYLANASISVGLALAFPL